MDKNNKKNTKLKIATILSWVTCCILCLLFDRCNLSVPAVRWMTCAIFCSLILSIVLSVKLKKSKPKIFFV